MWRGAAAGSMFQSAVPPRTAAMMSLTVSPAYSGPSGLGRCPSAPVDADRRAAVYALTSSAGRVAGT